MKALFSEVAQYISTQAGIRRGFMKIKEIVPVKMLTTYTKPTL